MFNSNIPNISSISILKAKVELFDGSTLTDTCTCSDYLQDFTVNKEGVVGKFFGFGICQELKLNLIDIERTLNPVTTSHTAKVAFGDGTIFDYPYPTFYITEVSIDEDDNTITATAYDSLYKAASHTFSELGLTAPYTVQNVAQAIADLLGVGLSIQDVTGSAFSTSYAEGANLEDTENLREILNQIAEVTQTIYFINYNNELVFKRLTLTDNPVTTITRDNYYIFHSKTSRTLSTIRMIADLDEIGIEASTGEEGVTQYIRNNAFWELREDVDTLLNNAISNIGGLTITQFDCEWEGNHLLEIGDLIHIETEDGGHIATFILSDTVTYDGGITELTEWLFEDNESETDSNPTSLGARLKQTSAKVDKINQEISLVITQVSDTQSQVAQIQMDIDNIDLNVSEAVQKELENFTVSTDNIEGLDELTEKVNENTEKISGIELDLNGVTTTVTENTTKITTLEDKTGQLQSTSEVHTSQISSLQVNSDSISAKVTSVETTTKDSIDSMNGTIDTLSKEVALKMSEEDVTIAIQSELENGVDKVTTTTKKYTFNDDGLNISASGSEISTKITEDGMRVYKGGNEVLTADNTGVKAQDLHAVTYLIIGDTSRLEDRLYRTACFWIGDD